MKFIADFHVHSRYSIATSKSLDFENLYIAARLKGINVVGCGDITHPKWFQEAREKLMPAEKGLFKLHTDISTYCDKEIHSTCRGPVRFILTSEISNIYKKRGKTRKNHNVVFLPDFDVAERFNRKLERIGNIHSDGRPILGLDVRNLLEILLDTSDQAFLIPAHIWTPWFSILGSKSGFDSIEECFEDLTRYVFAVETGLSSDPKMNWRVTDLDGMTLVSNSDAHSPMKLGREANLFNTDMTYSGIKNALQKNEKGLFLGTFEFYPEEGKYHLDGHRKCGVSFEPYETVAADGTCPVCGKPLTLGVLHRIEELADRKEDEQPEKARPFYSVIPLMEVISEILKVGVNTKKVKTYYHKALSIVGTEFDILHKLPTEKIRKAGIPLLTEAIEKMRNKKIRVKPGFDGEFGKISIFSKREREKLLAQKSLFVFNNEISKSKESRKRGKRPSKEKKTYDKTVKSLRKEIPPPSDTIRLSREQRLAVEYQGGSQMIVAGPGSGKTLTLTHRIAYLIRERNVAAENILGLTFTNKAAKEMMDRIEDLIGEKETPPYISTFHSLCLHLIQENQRRSDIAVVDEEQQKSIISDSLNAISESDKSIKLNKKKVMRWLNYYKTEMINPEMEAHGLSNDKERRSFLDVYQNYHRILSVQGLFDYEDLIIWVVKRLKNDKKFRSKLQTRFRYVFVDEYQDLNTGQYMLIRSLSTKDNEICVIGDPDQSIYGFRGSRVEYFNTFIEEYPDARIFHLEKNYRSTQTILKAAEHVIRKNNPSRFDLQPNSAIKGKKTISIHELKNQMSEAVCVGKEIERLIGGAGFQALNFEKFDGYDSSTQYGFSDFGVLFRTRDQIGIFSECFEKAGIPFQISTTEGLFKIAHVDKIISLLKLTGGIGTFLDLEKTAGLLKGQINKKTLTTFKRWSLEKGFSLKQASNTIKSFPVHGMKKPEQRRLVSLLNEVSEIGRTIHLLNMKEKILQLSIHTYGTGGNEESRMEEEALKRLVDLSEGVGKDTRHFISTLSLKKDTDLFQTKSDKVAFLTIHASKGLEFPVVFISGCEDGYIPLRKEQAPSDDPEEERRIFYVGMTRAKERLYLTYARQRSIFGRKTPRIVSPFIEDIENDIITYNRPDPGKQKKKSQVQLNLFSS